MYKIVITGPESSGKSTLAKQLAKFFKVLIINEYAREYLESRKIPQYNYDDLLEIAYKQYKNEQEGVLAATQLMHEFIIIDTNLVTIKIWANIVFKNCPQWILDKLSSDNDENHLKSFYLLCSPEGIAWEYDPLRENPNNRDILFQIYENELVLYKKNYSILRGSKEDRFLEAIKIIENLK